MNVTLQFKSRHDFRAVEKEREPTILGPALVLLRVPTPPLKLITEATGRRPKSICDKRE